MGVQQYITTDLAALDAALLAAVQDLRCTPLAALLGRLLTGIT